MWPRNPDKKGQREAEAARSDACESAKKIKSRQPEVSEVSSGLRQFRDNNHFAEKLLVIMKHNPKGGSV